MKIVVYTTASCVQCTATKRALNQAGAAFEERRVEDHPDIVEEAKAAELARTGKIPQAPIVVAGDGTYWCGYRPDRIREAVANQRYEQDTRSGLDELAEA